MEPRELVISFPLPPRKAVRNGTASVHHMIKAKLVREYRQHCARIIALTYSECHLSPVITEEPYIGTKNGKPHPKIRRIVKVPVFQKAVYDITYGTAKFSKGDDLYRPRDGANGIDGTKACIDECANQGIIIDDSDKYLKLGTFTFDKSFQGIRITFREQP